MLNIINLLIKKQDNIHLENIKRRYFCSKSYSDCKPYLIKYLKDYSYDNINQCSYKNENLLANDTIPLDNFQALLENGINVNNLNRLHQNALISNIDNIKKIKLLIKYGIDINNIDQYGRNALWYANYQTSCLLLKNGIKIHDNDDFKFELLNSIHMCVKKIDLLFSHGLTLPSAEYKKYPCIFNSMHPQSIEHLFSKFPEIDLSIFIKYFIYDDALSRSARDGLEKQIIKNLHNENYKQLLIKYYDENFHYLSYYSHESRVIMEPIIKIEREKNIIRNTLTEQQLLIKTNKKRL